jgi:hypothetical protein
MLLLAPAKILVVRRGLRRPGRLRKVVSLTFTVLVLAAIGSGLIHAVGGWRPYLGLLPMQLHVGAAVGAVALLIAHVVMHHRSARHRWRPLLHRTDLTRRRALLGAGVVAGPGRCCWRRMPVAVRSRAATAPRPGSSRRGGAGSGG